MLAFQIELIVHGEIKRQGPADDRRGARVRDRDVAREAGAPVIDVGKSRRRLERARAEVTIAGDRRPVEQVVRRCRGHARLAAQKADRHALARRRSCCCSRRCRSRISCRYGWRWSPFQIDVIVAAKLNCNTQLVIGVVPVLATMMLAWNPLFQTETSEKVAVAP